MIKLDSSYLDFTFTSKVDNRLHEYDVFQEKSLCTPQPYPQEPEKETEILSGSHTFFSWPFVKIEDADEETRGGLMPTESLGLFVLNIW